MKRVLAVVSVVVLAGVGVFSTGSANDRAVAEPAAQARTPKVTVSAEGSGRATKVTYTVNRKPAAVASRKCTLDKTRAVSCGKQVSRTYRSATYRATLKHLAYGRHVFAVVVRLAPGTKARGRVSFTVRTPQCLVVNQTTAESSTGTGRNLQTAIYAATSGDTLQIEGKCFGTFTTSADLSLVGSGTPQATLDGDNQGTVLKVSSGVAVSLTDLTLTGGGKANRARTPGGGIRNLGTVTLNGSSSITGNSATNGAGIRNRGGTVTLNDSSSIRRNTATAFGGGIYTGGVYTGGVYTGSGSVTMNESSSITDNTAGGAGGIYLYNGLVTLNASSSITDNTAIRSGGIFVYDGTVKLKDSSSIADNTTKGRWGVGGGIENFGTVELHDSSSITGNTAAKKGGGAYNHEFGSVTLYDSSSITGNTATKKGGGIYNREGSVTMNESSSITGNTATSGGGICSREGSVTMNESSSITGNTATKRGGGIYNREGMTSREGLVTMNGSSSIADNTAASGGGIYNDGGTLTNAVAGVNVVGNSPDDIVPV